MDSDVADAIRASRERATETRVVEGTTPRTTASVIELRAAPEPLSDRSLAAHEDQRRLEAAKVELHRRGEPWDVRIVMQVLEPGRFRRTLARGYRMTRSFLVAHRWGWVPAEVARSRDHVCGRCSYLRHETVGDVRRRYCRAENGGQGCGCPKGPAWPFGALDYKNLLGHWQCPIGKFEVLPSKVSRVVSGVSFAVGIASLGFLVLRGILWIMRS